MRDDAWLSKKMGSSAAALLDEDSSSTGATVARRGGAFDDEKKRVLIGDIMPFPDRDSESHTFVRRFGRPK